MPPKARNILLVITSSLSLGIVIWGICTGNLVRVLVGAGLLLYYGTYYYYTRPFTKKELGDWQD